MATREPTALDGLDDTILTALAPTQHVYQALPTLHDRSGVPAADLRRRLRRLEQSGYVHRLRTDAEAAEAAEAHYCLSLAGVIYAAARSS
jgi:DNA-binding IclR family transcriptional regulator